MPIAFDCACGKAFRVPDALAGNRTKCPECGATVAVPAATASPPPPPTPPTKKPRPVRRPRDDGGGGGFRIALSPAVAGGLVSMVVGAVWFFVGLEANRVFIYPPILFVFGLVAVVRGLFGAPEE